MQATRQHHRDTSTEAGAYAAGLSGAQAYQDQQAFGAGAPTYDAAHNVIANKPACRIDVYGLRFGQFFIRYHVIHSR